MKVLGISFGKVMGNTDILVKEALYGAKEAGAEVEFVNTISMDIGRCIGCGACSAMLSQGKDNECIVKDDYQALEEKIHQADGIVLGAPVYVLQPVGQFKDFVDRFGPRHDRAGFLVAQKNHPQGKPNFDQRKVKQQYVSYISVGGATTRNWTSMGLISLHLFGFPSLMHVVGEIDAYRMGRTVSPVFDEKLIARTNELGARTAQAIGKAPEDIEWFGEQGVCPVCHQRTVTCIGGDKIECPLCGIYGRLTLEGGEIKAIFTEKEQQRARGRLEGQAEHIEEIMGFGPIAQAKFAEEKERMLELLKRYKEFDQSI